MARRLTKRDTGRRLVRLAHYLEGRADDAKAQGRPATERAYDDALQHLLEVFDDLEIDFEAAYQDEGGSDATGG